MKKYLLIAIAATGLFFMAQSSFQEANAGGKVRSCKIDAGGNCYGTNGGCICNLSK